MKIKVYNPTNTPVVVGAGNIIGSREPARSIDRTPDVDRQIDLGHLVVIEKNPKTGSEPEDSTLEESKKTTDAPSRRSRKASTRQTEPLSGDTSSDETPEAGVGHSDKE